MARIRSMYADHFIEAVYDADVLSIRMGLAGRADKWWRIFSGAYRRSKALLRGYVQGKLTGKPTAWLSWVDELLAFQKAQERFKELDQTGKSLFGAQWQGARSDWQVLGRISEWVIDLYQEIGKGDLPEGLTDFLEADPDLKSWSGQIADLKDDSLQVQGLVTEATNTLQWPEKCHDNNVAEWGDLLEGWQDTAALYAMVRFNQLRQGLESAGLGSLIPELRGWVHAPRALVNWLKLSYYAGLVDTAYAQAPRIGQFDRLTHERLLQEFSRLDQSTFSYAQELLVNKLHNELPSYNAPGEMDLLRREFSKKRRHIPIRRLIGEAANVIQQAKPVFMMSPMSVATYLPQGKVKFDLVIFDEASQIPAPEAFGAILRGSQVVVVGDSKQMPPTNFFGKAVEISDEDAEQSATADVESILELMLARGAPQRMLRWHYRSRHHSLIAVSNEQFYNNQLLIFPSSNVDPHARGLKLNHLPDTHYDRGGSRANLGEARSVARAVLEHALGTPQLSLGVVAFSHAQRDVIMLEVERLRRSHPETENFFQYHAGGDEFFVKNLENVQGDERDVIFISIGYGRTAAGTFSKSFGPLNFSGGERRLNVLISRARLAMDVFSNFKAEDLPVEATSPFGVRALKAFLQYAETGELPQSQESEREMDSPFEVEVKQAIEGLGYEVEPQVGCQGFFIDLAVRDPQKPGRYLLAVECDGASYHSSAFARDRDRLRQSVLEGLGWRFHRIWSTEWFRNAPAELERAKEAIEAATRDQERTDARVNEPVSISRATAAAAPEIVRIESEDVPVLSVPPYKQIDEQQLGLPIFVGDFLEIPTAQLLEAIIAVIHAEAPVHVNVVTSRLISAVGIARAGSRIQDKVLQCIERLESRNMLAFKADFLSIPQANAKPPLRDWSGLSPTQRKFDYVPDDELAHAVFMTIHDGYSVAHEDCMSAALNLLGFKRLTTAIKERLNTLIQALLVSGLLREQAGRLQLTDHAREAGFTGLS